MNRFSTKFFAVLSAFTMVLFGTVALATTAGAQGATDDASEMEAGEAVFASNCAGCHGDDGAGVSGVGRPLTDIASQADRAQHIAAVADGKGTMPGFSSRLSDDEIGAVVSYVRLGFVSESMTDDAEATTMETTSELAQTGSSAVPLTVFAVGVLLSGMVLVERSRRQLQR